MARPGWIPAPVCVACRATARTCCIRLDNLPNDEEHTALIHACIAVIAARFGDKAVDIDRKVFNPARLCKLYGTLVRKGENMPDRPHRRSKSGFARCAATTAQPRPTALAGRQAAEPARVTVPRTGMQVTAGRRLDVPAYLAAAGLVEGRDYRVKHKQGTTWYNLRLCPVHADPNANFECGICQGDDGAMGAKCQHDSAKTWRDFKAALGDPARFYWATRQVSRANNSSFDKPPGLNSFHPVRGFHSRAP